jgi:hypothetical protein
MLSGCTRFQPTRIKKEIRTQTGAQTSTSSVTVLAYSIYDDTPAPTARDIFEQAHLLSLSITNKTNASIFIDSTQITPHIMQKQDFAQLVPKSYGCYFIPAIVVGSTGILFLWQVGVPLAGLLTLFGINQSRREAEHTVVSFNEQTLNGTQTIAPHSTRTFLIAISKTLYQPDLTVMIQTKSSSEKCSLHIKKTPQSSYHLI